MSPVQVSPLQAVAERIIARYLKRGFSSDVQIVSGFEMFASRGMDITYTASDGNRRAIKLKADPYFGTDSSKIGDRRLPFYRADTGSLAFEAVSNSATKEPGWMISSGADELYYYYLAIAQEEAEVSALLQERDEVFFSEILVERDDLIVLPFAETRAWFTAKADKYATRPVFTGAIASWDRLVARSDVQRQVKGARIVGPVFPGLAL